MQEGQRKGGKKTKNEEEEEGKQKEKGVIEGGREGKRIYWGGRGQSRAGKERIFL